MICKLLSKGQRKIPIYVIRTTQFPWQYQERRLCLNEMICYNPSNYWLSAKVPNSQIVVYLDWSCQLSLTATWREWLQLKKYYQPRKSRRSVLVNLEGIKVPLYGAGSSLTVLQTGGVVVPFTLQFEIRSRGDVVGKLVRTRHRKQITCPVTIDSTSTKPITFKKDSCTYNWCLLPLWIYEFRRIPRRISRLASRGNRLSNGLCLEENRLHVENCCRYFSL